MKADLRQQSININVSYLVIVVVESITVLLLKMWSMEAKHWITWESVRNVESQTLNQTYFIKSYILERCDSCAL